MTVCRVVLSFARFASRAGLAATGLFTRPLPAHEEWNSLHIVYSARTSFTYPFDGRSPKVAVALLNHYPVTAPATNFTFSVNGQLMDGTSFASFPNLGSIVAGPDEYGIASVLTAGIYDGRAGPPPAIGETKEYIFRWDFALAPGARPPPGTVVSNNPDPANNFDVPGVTTARVSFTNAGDSPTLNGPLGISGIVRLASPPVNPPAVEVEVSTPYSNWFAISTSAPSASAATSFSQALPARDDWHVRVSADGYETRVLPVGFVNDPRSGMDVTLAAAVVPDIDYRRSAAISTPTGFWRGAVSESEGTFVVFPGQENWRSAANDAEARALRAAARIYKYRLDGTRVWEHAPGWETWAGDMTPDGRYVAYALNATPQTFYTPSEHKLVLLDGASGTVIWTKTAAPADTAIGRKIDALELTFSPDARWIAVGSTAGGTVTLVDRASGNFLWTVPGSAPSFGQVRKLRFSPDAQFLYVGSGDSNLRKLRVSDGTVIWKTFAGGWPFVNGLDLTPDGAWLVAGTRSLDATLVRASDGFMQWQRETQYVDAVFASDGRHVATRGGQLYRTVDGSLAGMTKTSSLTRFTPDGRYVVQLDRELRLHDLGGKLLKTFEASGIGTNANEQPQWAHLTSDGRHAIVLARDMTAASQIGIALYERRAAISAAVPVITAQPLVQTVTSGTTATLSVTATGGPPLSYQWQRNGVNVSAPAGTSPLLIFPAVSAAEAGAYTCVVSNAAGAASTAAAALSVVPADATNPSRLANIAVRASVDATAPLIVGFSVGGAGTSGTKLLLIRAAGPSLATVGVSNPLADPTLGLFNGSTNVISNDNWSGDAQVASLANQLGAFPFSAAASRDAALAATAVGGSYTAQLASSDATSGTALAEIYDGSSSFTAATPRLVNVSARTNVGGGASVLIAGFVIAGSAAKTVLIRGIGPGLATFNVSNALADPQLALFRDGVPVATNDDWYDAPNSVSVAAAARLVGAFVLPPTSRDAALLLSLPPGSYTAQLSGNAATATAGNALVEVYDVP
jgi:hypothetical protein